MDTVLEHDLQDGVVGAAHILHLLQSVLVGDNNGSVGDLQRDVGSGVTIYTALITLITNI